MMKKRYASLWFRHLKTDWMTVCKPHLQEVPFVLALAVHGKLIVNASNLLAEQAGVHVGMAIADARAFIPSLHIIHEQAGLAEKILHFIAHWCIRYTPQVSLDKPDGIVLDISGCAHLWGGEAAYLEYIVAAFKRHGYDVCMSIADTIGAAWAMARFGPEKTIISEQAQSEELLSLSPAALRLEQFQLNRLQSLGLKTIGSFAHMPRSVLRRRFGDSLLLRLDQAMGFEDEFITSIKPVLPYEERLPCLEPISTANGIELALKELLIKLCRRLSGEGKGLREAELCCHRVDGKIERITIETNRATAQVNHLFQLFAIKIPQVEPALGIELFSLAASSVEDADAVQENLWDNRIGLKNPAVTELLDRLKSRDSSCEILRYVPAAHYWPERSMKIAATMDEVATVDWQTARPRPTRLLKVPERIVVTAPIPDYPPILFIYKRTTHYVKKADGPERIEREWWMDQGEHRDYYAVEDQEGRRFWLFRAGHYDGQTDQWFIHGFFA
ncbi:DNA polymerase Y family protein [Sphingobacterium sp.]|uniref:Y-family DNA polymerase n=1 Tax=Sphingobacterium sp. TaxID=341027 RepID=UPI00289BECE0|nr:DNA polymerase Y family protein [Sphingobacterium sp.]